MATKTQKNFKKQMAEIQKNMPDENSSQFYSYIENDHIESYYKPKKKRKAAAISLGSILSFLLIGYSVYTWIKPSLIQADPSYPMVNSIALDSKGVLTLSHKDIAEYLKQIEQIDTQINKYLTGCSRDFNSILKDQNSRNSFIETNAKFKTELEKIILSLSNIQVPEEMTEYHSTIKAKCDNLYEEVVYCIDIASSNNTNNIAHLKYLTEKYNLLQKQQIQQMLSAFDRVGIKYEQNGSNIKYWYKN